MPGPHSRAASVTALWSSWVGVRRAGRVKRKLGDRAGNESAELGEPPYEHSPLVCLQRSPSLPPLRCHGYSAAGWLSPVELTESVLGRIATMEEDLNAYVTVVAESARRAAARAEREIAAAGHRSPLHGQPQSAPISWMYAPEAFGASGEDGFGSGGRR